MQNKRQKKSVSIALPGVLSALAVVVLLMGDILPMAEIAAPALAGLVLLPVGVELDGKTHLLAYGAVSLLGLMLLAQKETPFLFCFVFGYYPVLQKRLQARIHTPALCWGAKLLWAVGAVLACYGLLWLLFPLQAGLEDATPALAALSGTLTLALLWVYDLLVTRMEKLYLLVWRRRLKRFL